MRPSLAGTALLALALFTCACAYTVDCNHEYADCDTELSKLANEDEDLPSPSESSKVVPDTTTTIQPKRSTANPLSENTATQTFVKTNEESTTEAIIAGKPKPRLLNLSVDELQNFANALHNQSSTDKEKKLSDLSDVNLDTDDDDDTSKILGSERKSENAKDLPDKFYSNLQEPFHPLMNVDRSDESETCKENGITYKLGDHIDRSCDETCECSTGGVFDCSPRCKHPYIRRGRRLNDPLCFESPVDECCSIIACATGNGAVTTKLEVCKYSNETYPVGSKWNIGCQKTCSCEPNSVVSCVPRCKPIPQSDKCINVQDPNDACCEMQICDVSQDVHEEPMDNNTTIINGTSSTIQPAIKDSDSKQNIEITPAKQPMISKSTMRPLVLMEPIGSIKVLQNNSVQVNLIHINDTKDPIHLLLSSDGGKTFENIELQYSNLLLNLDGGKDYILKTKETGTKFNFTITSTASFTEIEPSNFTMKIGCHQDGKFYEVGEEFHVGCSELCECTGDDIRECAALECPSHVGLELVSKGCVRWAPSPPPSPPNCCPRAARCISDGTCHYKGIAVPNWSEVPIALTGCEQRCFCENGELDCQEVCSPLPPLPPQTLRCPIGHRPAPVNISDEDCCKQWACVPKAGETNFQILAPSNYVTPIPPIMPPVATVLPLPLQATESVNFDKPIQPVNTGSKFYGANWNIAAPYAPVGITQFATDKPSLHKEENITVYTLHDIDEPIKTIMPDHSITTTNGKWDIPQQNIKTKPALIEPLSLSTPGFAQIKEKPKTFVIPDSKMHDIIDLNKINKNNLLDEHMAAHDVLIQQTYDPTGKVPVTRIDNYNYFSPRTSNLKPSPSYDKHETVFAPVSPIKQQYFEPLDYSANYFNHTVKILTSKTTPTIQKSKNHTKSNNFRKHVTILHSKDHKGVNTPNLGREPLWQSNTKILKNHLLTKSLNPYQTVLHRSEPDIKMSRAENLKTASKTYSTMDLERILTQMEVESEVNRNLERAAVKSDTAGSTITPEISTGPQHPQLPLFLPTVTPEINFPQDDIPDYDQNNVNRPVHTSGPDTNLPPIPGLPANLPIAPNYGEENKKLTVISVESDSPTSVKMLFGLPPVLVGLRGSVDLRYTEKQDEDISHWYSQVFAPADEILTTSRLEFRLSGLKPATRYKLRGRLYLHNLPVQPQSDLFFISTQPLPTLPPMDEKQREINSALRVAEVNDTTAQLGWRHFTEDELQYVDGIQVRYRPVGTPIYSMTELLHHSRWNALLVDLRPGVRYEASLVLIPPPRSSVELHDPATVHFTTEPFVDPYNWTVTLEARAVGSEAAELTWAGVPSPPERWVRVYRAAHACGDVTTSAREQDEFRLAQRDQPPSITITGLQSDTRCRVWLELFLTNGKVKTSNVLEIHTKSIDSPEPIDTRTGYGVIRRPVGSVGRTRLCRSISQGLQLHEIAASSISREGGSGPRGDYYGALVVVGVVAALGALTSLLLLLVVVRRHRPRSVPITPVPTAPRESSLPPYDNPAFKLELQQETMDL